MLTVGAIVIRVDDIERQRAFWKAALGYTESIVRPDDFIVLEPSDGEGPSIALDKWHAPRVAPPRIHLDLYAGDQAAEVARLLELGAREVDWDGYPENADYVVLADPEDNRFCVIDAAGKG